MRMIPVMVIRNRAKRMHSIVRMMPYYTRLLSFFISAVQITRLNVPEIGRVKTRRDCGIVFNDPITSVPARTLALVTTLAHTSDNITIQWVAYDQYLSLAFLILWLDSIATIYTCSSSRVEIDILTKIMRIMKASLWKLIFFPENALTAHWIVIHWDHNTATTGMTLLSSIIFAPDHCAIAHRYVYYSSAAKSRTRCWNESGSDTRNRNSSSRYPEASVG